MSMKDSLKLLTGKYWREAGTEKICMSQIDSHGRYRFEIQLTSDAKEGINFCLCDGGSCVIANVQILSNYSSSPIVTSNGINLGDSYIFCEANPLFNIKLDGEETWLEIYLNYLPFNAENFNSVFEKIANLIRERESLRQLEENHLNRENKYLEKIEELTEQISNNLVLYDELRSTITQQAQEIQRFKVDYDTISNATFWKLTAPLRQSTELIKKIVRRAKRKNISYVHKMGNSLSRKISSFQDLTNVYPKENICNSSTLINYDCSNGLKVLLVTHELALTGAPVALFYFAEILKEQGFCPVLISPKAGSLLQECENLEIPVIIDETIYRQTTYLNYIRLFDVVVANTIVSAPIVNGLANTDIPVLWWIHEAETSYQEKNFFGPMPQHLPDNAVVYTVGEYAYKMLLKYKPLYAAENLFYYIPEIDALALSKKILPPTAENKTVFAIVGLLEFRKGQDVLVDAIRKLDSEHLKDSYFVFVGKQCYPPIYEKIMGITQEYPNNTLYINELSRNEMSQLYEEIDCLVCTSKDDPMPIVVTEALQHGKYVICSENTGTAAVLEQEQYGLIYQNNDTNQLAEKLTYVLKNKNVLSNKKDIAINIYKKYFSKDVFLENAIRAIKETRDFNKWHPQYQGTLFSINNFLHELSLHQIDSPYSIWGQDILKTYDENGKRNILLVSHEMSLTGAPIVLQNLGNTLQALGYNVTVISPFDGPLVEAISEDKIPVIVYEHLYSNDFLRTYAECFDLILINTVVTYRLIEQLRGTQVPILWWIHDSKASYEIGGFRECLPKNLPSNVHIYCGGEYAQEQLLKYYPEYHGKTNILYYCAPDATNKYKDFYYQLPFKKNGRILFTIIGQQDTRKGHDIFAAAIKNLPAEVREKGVFLFIGRHLDPNIKIAVNSICASYPDNVFYIEEVKHCNLFSVISQSDCIVCSSKDDPLPVFVTESMMMGVLTICSEFTGTASIIEKECCGLTYKNNDYRELAKKIEYVTEHLHSLDSLRTAARRAYETYFSEAAFCETIRTIWDSTLLPKDNDILFHGVVSIIIPTYNAGKNFEETLKSLRSQKKVEKIEIIVVDSGSQDQTLDICYQYNVRLYQIPHEDFSHSYARNLGVQYAVGDIVLFMTQDAIPIGNDWIYKMISPIIDRTAAATSCTEKNPEDTELFYKIATEGYDRFRRTNTGNQLNFYTGNESCEELRRKAALTDIATAILASVFKQMYYRYSYAEDLDMGIRLLQNGYRIMLLKDVCILHGHNRSYGYYIRRAFSESRAFERILPNQPIIRDNFSVIALRVISACQLVYIVNSSIMAKVNKHSTLDEYISDYIYKLHAEMSDDTAIMRVSECSFGDGVLDYCYHICKEACVGELHGDYAIVHSVIYYLTNDISAYFENSKTKLVDYGLAKQIEDCIFKQMSIYIGEQLSHVKDRQLKSQKLDELMSGI